MSPFNTATAHLDWEREWRTEAGRQDWLLPEPEVLEVAEALHLQRAYRILDLGCGVGRHSLMLAREGFEVDALDGSPTAVALTRQAAAEAGLNVVAREGLMTALPYADGSFDFVLAWNVIYHGGPEVVSHVIGEIRRVLQPHGWFLGTLLTTRNSNYGRGREVAPDTFVIDHLPDKCHPHFYCDARDACRLFADFEILSLHQQEHQRPGSWHWHLLAERR